MFVEDVHQEDKILDFLDKSRIKKKNLNHKLSTSNAYSKADFSGSKVTKLERTASECQKVFMVKSYIKQEIVEDPKIWDSKPFLCNTCRIIFTKETQLMIHNQKMHKENDVSVINEHERINILRSKMCRFCGKGFKSRKTLINHEMFHQGETPYPCQNSKMNRHNELPFICDSEGCGQKFAFAFLMKKHLKTHLDLQPYLCDRCKKPFSTKGNLKRHFNNSLCSTLVAGLDKKRYICDGCMRSFTVKGNLKRHMKTSCPAETNKN